MNRRWLVMLVAVFASSADFAADAPTVRLHSAGSLRAAMTDISAAYTSAYGAAVEPVYGASGGLGDRLAKGEAGDVFTSADMGYPEALTKARLSGPTVLFACNHLCAILRPGLPATPKTVLATLLKPGIKIGTSSPDKDPGGAYAWAMFKKADRVKPGSRAMLEAKAVKMGSAPGAQRSTQYQERHGVAVSREEARCPTALTWFNTHRKVLDVDTAEAKAAKLPFLSLVPRREIRRARR